MAITPDGRTIYMPDGEKEYDSNIWRVVNAATGKVTGSISAGHSPHNTIMGLDGKYVYLGGCGDAFLGCGEHGDEQRGAKDRAAEGPGCAPVHDQRLADARLHHRQELPGLPGQQHPTGKVLYIGRSSWFHLRSGDFRTTAPPTMAFRSRRTSASST